MLQTNKVVIKLCVKEKQISEIKLVMIFCYFCYFIFCNSFQTRLNQFLCALNIGCCVTSILNLLKKKRM